MRDKIILKVVGYDENCWQVSYLHTKDKTFWIPKESFLVTNDSKTAT